MKKLIKLLFTVIILLGVFVLNSCEKESFITPQKNLEGQQIISSQNQKNSNGARLVKAVPECDLVSIDWDGTYMNIGQTKTYEIKLVSNAIYKWTVSGSIIIIGSSNNNKVTIKAIGSGIAHLSVTMDVPGNAILACGNTGSISILGIGSCTPPTPVFQVMDPNWNNNGETCPYYTLELGVISDVQCNDFTKYEWIIQGATIQSTTPDGRYIYVKTGRVNTYLTFKVRGVYQSATTGWSSKYGKTIPGICGL